MSYIEIGHLIKLLQNIKYTINSLIQCQGKMGSVTYDSVHHNRKLVDFNLLIFRLKYNLSKYL